MKERETDYIKHKGNYVLPKLISSPTLFHSEREIPRKKLVGRYEE
jgi:hypothetical protein